MFKTKKKIFLSLILAVLLLLLSANFSLARDQCDKDEDCIEENQVCRNSKCVRALEVDYPTISGITPSPDDLAGYFNYIFRFAVWIIGLIIFGVLVYNGILYIVSTGDPAKISHAKSGIFAGALGAIILLSSVIIFETINPYILTFRPGKITPLPSLLNPGIILCNFKIDENEVEAFLKSYSYGDTEERKEGALRFREFLGSGGRGGDCIRIDGSISFPRHFRFTRDNRTWFMIPKLSGYDPQTDKFASAEYDYGIIFFEKDNFGGQGACHLFPKDTNNIFTYENNKDPHLNSLAFQPQSVALFQIEKRHNAMGKVTLYSDENFNTGVPAGEDKYRQQFIISGNDEVMFIRGNIDSNLIENTDSIEIEGTAFALLFESNLWHTDRDKRCEIITESNSNLTKNWIGRCGPTCTYTGIFARLRNINCQSCLQSMIIIKGEKII